MLNDAHYYSSVSTYDLNIGVLILRFIYYRDALQRNYADVYLLLI